MVEFEYRKLQIQLIAKERVFSNCSYLAHRYLAASGQGAELPLAGVVVYMSLSNKES